MPLELVLIVEIDCLKLRALIWLDDIGATQQIAKEVEPYAKESHLSYEANEWDKGHSEGAKLITLSEIPQNIEEIKSWGKPVIAVCRSGARSGNAAGFLEEQGIDIINGGPWGDVDQFL